MTTARTEGDIMQTEQEQEREATADAFAANVKAFSEAATNLLASWDQLPGDLADAAVEDYPESLPDFAEVVAEIQMWAAGFREDAR